MEALTIDIVRTDATHPDFQELVKFLDADLAIRDGEDHDFYHQFNSIESLKNVVVIFHNKVAVACGAFKPYDSTTIEIKRMYTQVQSRGSGFAQMALGEVEKWAAELGYLSALLETGIKQPEAIALYRKLGYHLRANYGPYAGLKTSLCFEKKWNHDR